MARSCIGAGCGPTLTWRASRRPKVDHSRPSNYSLAGVKPEILAIEAEFGKEIGCSGRERSVGKMFNTNSLFEILASELTKAEQYILKRYGQNVRLRPSKFAMRIWGIEDLSYRK